ncbi:MAG: 16S rRNA processing protein RimM [Arcobacter sp.]|nr:MAG: 16S rRNA processing protein RimM [Arcobacter sp.]
MNNKIYVAKLGKAVGLKGHLRLIIDSDFPSQFKKDAVFVTNKKIELKVQEYNTSRELIKFENYDDVDTAKKLTNQELYASEEETKKNCQLEEDQYFWFDIIGCEIKEDGNLLGKIKEVHRYPLDDYFEIETNENLIKEGLAKVFLIPYVVETYIINVDIDNKVIETKDCFAILENS